MKNPTDRLAYQLAQYPGMFSDGYRGSRLATFNADDVKAIIEQRDDLLGALGALWAWQGSVQELPSDELSARVRTVLESCE